MPDSFPPPPDLDLLTRSQVLMALALTAALLLLLAKAWMVLGQASVLPVQFSGGAIALGGGLGLALAGLSALAYRLWPPYSASADAYLDLLLRPLTWTDLFWLGLLPALSEELLFRGVMLPALGLTWWGILASSLCFGLLHLLSLRHWPYALWAATVGLVLGVSAWLSGNLLVPAIAHAAINWLSSGVWKLRHRTP
ncbi:MAG: CPBP family intramembrane metalloprotease [Cyanobacteria bacterium]|nr:CPBP family intramembrane metalloprotease [Cyanobacteriota bacterium]